MTLADYRALFEMPPGVAYLDHAATGTLPRPAADAAADYLAGRAGRLPDRSPNNFPADLDRIDRVRRRAAELVGAAPEAVCIVPNTSYGLNLVAQGLDWRPGDRVVVPGCEFPANLLPWRGLAHLGVEVDGVPHREGTFTVADVEAAMTERTRVVAVSAVQFLSGFRADLDALGALCRERDVLFVVDAIQGAGVLRFHLAEIRPDLFTFGAHKWMGAMQGAGIAVVGDALRDRLRPLRGWLNGPVDWDDFEASTLDLHPDATRFHVGTMPTAALYALDAALGAQLDIGTEIIEAAALAHAARLGEGLEALGLERYGPKDTASAIVTVRADDPEGLHAHLAKRGVVASLRSRLLRFAPHTQTPPEAIDQALEAVADFDGVTV